MYNNMNISRGKLQSISAITGAFIGVFYGFFVLGATVFQPMFGLSVGIAIGVGTGITLGSIIKIRSSEELALSSIQKTIFYGFLGLSGFITLISLVATLDA
jgi:hypothetical protein